MNINNYQEQLLHLLNVKEVEFENIDINNFLSNMEKEVTSDNVKIASVSVRLLKVHNLIQHDYYYTSYKRYDDVKCYRSQYTDMKPFNYPLSKPSFASAGLPMIPHLFVNLTSGFTQTVKLPNEILHQLDVRWNDNEEFFTKHNIEFTPFIDEI